MLGMTEDEIQQHDFNIQSFGQTQFISLAGWYDYGFVPEKHLKNTNEPSNFSGLIDD